ncbi:YgaP family membrane protein [Azospirillum argentinense]|uniref:Inner membrane protein YgaP-like transmembrane domain-containing protein n=1 Tax=Azospirillum argentinense TaxID=2970906 RepID=A0A5B0KR87_9PROT|nr:DUF2892 domain-containing protein [Azospirillum argentinense]KAA1054471.1 hypothetical protein FH063_006306 [Azospirillum argentinense]
MSAENAIRHTYDRFFGGERNLGPLERAVSTGLGLVMAAGGVRRGADVRGTIMGLAGAALVARGMSGHCPLKAMVADEDHDRLSGPRSERYSPGEGPLERTPARTGSYS